MVEGRVEVALVFSAAAKPALCHHSVQDYSALIPFYLSIIFFINPGEQCTTFIKINMQNLQQFDIKTIFYECKWVQIFS